jgi:exonuclease III
MKCNILSWNVRGLNSPDKMMMVRNLLRQWRVDIVCLQETKLEHISRRVVNSVWGCPYVDWCYAAAIGAAGGILLMWDKRVVSRLDMEVGECVAACSFKNVVEGFEWAFAGVYGPNGDFDRHCFWDEWAGLMSCWDLPWCIGGDFNVVRFPSERSGGRRISVAMREFLDFIFEKGLLDFPLTGGLCTWSNTRSWSRIDRFLISPDWEAKYPEALQKRLLCLCSDHFPIVLACRRNKGGRKSFKFENMWLKEEGFVDKGRGWWDSYNFQGTPSFIFAKKLRALKGDIINWNKTVFGNVGVLIKERTDELKALETAVERGGLSEEERERKRQLCRDLERALLQEEISWR